MTTGRLFRLKVPEVGSNSAFVGVSPFNCFLWRFPGQFLSSSSKVIMKTRFKHCFESLIDAVLETNW